MPKYYEEHSNEDALKALKKQVECWEQGEPFEYHLQPLKTAIKALERQIPKKVTHEASLIKCCTCPNCKNVVDKFEQWGETRVRITEPFCHFCGQALDWGCEE